MARQLRADSVYRHFFDNDGLSMWPAVTATARPSLSNRAAVDDAMSAYQRRVPFEPNGRVRPAAQRPARHSHSLLPR
jgi:hypothetical protein